MLLAGTRGGFVTKWHRQGASIFDLPLQCGPAVRCHNNLITLQDETVALREAIIRSFSEISLDSSVFRPTWVRKEGFTYKQLFPYLWFRWSRSKICQIGRINSAWGSTLVFVTRECRVLYFDDHFHSCYRCYSKQKLLDDLYNIHHAHKVNDNLHITLKNYFF